MAEVHRLFRSRYERESKRRRSSRGIRRSGQRCAAETMKDGLAKKGNRAACSTGQLTSTRGIASLVAARRSRQPLFISTGGWLMDLSLSVRTCFRLSAARVVGRAVVRPAPFFWLLRRIRGWISPCGDATNTTTSTCAIGGDAVLGCQSRSTGASSLFHARPGKSSRETGTEKRHRYFL